MSNPVSSPSKETMNEEYIKRSLQYVRNTNGGATKAHFLEDHEPIGDCLWRDMENAGYVRQDADARIHLTDAGNAALDAA